MKNSKENSNSQLVNSIKLKLEKESAFALVNRSTRPQRSLLKMKSVMPLNVKPIARKSKLKKWIMDSES